MDIKLEWKEHNERYLKAIEIFLDKVANIQEEKLRKEVIAAALTCDKILTELALTKMNENKSKENGNNIIKGKAF